MIIIYKRRNKPLKSTSVSIHFKKGRGVVNKLINKLPIELHIPGYQFCGPGTKLEKRLIKGQTGINPLDQACREHDIAYSQETNLQKRHEADKVLITKAVNRLKASDSSLGEKATALAVSGIMKGKVKMGMGSTKPRKKQKKPAKNRIVVPPKYGGFIPLLLPLLGALGALGGGAAGIATAVNKAQADKRMLEETQRHNKVMEAIGKGIGRKKQRKKRKGQGLYLKPYKWNQKNFQ